MMNPMHVKVADIDRGDSNSSSAEIFKQIDFSSSGADCSSTFLNGMTGSGYEALTAQVSLAFGQDMRTGH